jgi:hypothetical protein
MPAADYAPLDDALDLLAEFGPDLRNGMTNHAPMAVEALCALGRPDAVPAWLARYRTELLPWPAGGTAITDATWPAALGRLDRAGDWRAFFARAVGAAPWREVLATWTARLAPGFCAAATHGVIRVGHAARSLAATETAPRRRELGDALASWAYAYQTLPGAPFAGRPLPPRQALAQVAIVPPAARRFSGTITSSLAALADFPSFAPVIGQLDVDDDPSRLLPALAEAFARAYLANAHDLLTAVVFIHGVTSVVALGHVLPVLTPAQRRQALRFAWQSGCALYAAFATAPPLDGPVAAPREPAAAIVDLAIAHGDEHAIKFAEACIGLQAQTGKGLFLAAARGAQTLLARTNGT